MIGSPSQPAGGRRTRLWIALAVALVVTAGVGWAAWWVFDNIGAPGPAATGSGTCSSADAVSLQLVFADGHTIQICTRDRPSCPNQTNPNPNLNGTPQFNMNNQLRSSSRRYILFVRFDAGLPAEASDQTLRLDPQVANPGLQASPTSEGRLTSAEVQITPRDPDSDGYTADTGSLVVSSSHGQARGRIDGILGGGASGSPVGVTGSFVCNH